MLSMKIILDLKDKTKETKITADNTFNQYHFRLKGNHEWNYGKSSDLDILQIWNLCFNPYTTKDVYLPFPIIIWFFQCVSLLSFLLIAGNMCIRFYTKFWGKKTIVCGLIVLFHYWEANWSSKFVTKYRVVR